MNSEKYSFKSMYKVLKIHDDEIDLKDLEKDIGKIVIVNRNELFNHKGIDIVEGDIIDAEISSEDLIDYEFKSFKKVRHGLEENIKQELKNKGWGGDEQEDFEQTMLDTIKYKESLNDTIGDDQDFWKGFISELGKKNEELLMEAGWSKFKIFLDTKSFILEKNFDELIKNTKVTDNSFRKCPFKRIFLNKCYRQFVHYQGEEVKPSFAINGVLINDEMIKYIKNNNVKDFFGGMPSIVIPLRIYDLVKDEDSGTHIITIPQHGGKKSIVSAMESQSIELVNMDEHGKEMLLKCLVKIQDYVTNVLDFLNHPEVETIQGEQHGRNDRRMKKGKMPLTSKYHLVLKGKLKKYIYETIQKNKNLWEIGFRFWVRGHWVHFKSERYKGMRGKKSWILPYIKGKGDLVNKKYYLGEKERQWEHEKLMIELIQTIFPKNKLEKNNRTTLEGLEIDCYLPELKIGFEYNGEQHYNRVKIFHKTEEEFEAQKQRDIEKNKRAVEKGIRLITIRYDEVLSKELIMEKLK